ncbi:MAG: hypothetical protein HYS12_17245 [Planctomycetes bacterium]|nr:hypothetical protein [Planctomycetota bacterium]
MQVIVPLGGRAASLEASAADRSPTWTDCSPNCGGWSDGEDTAAVIW